MVEELISALERFDAILDIAVKQFASGDGSDASADAYRGLQIRPADVDRLLGTQPCVPCFTVGGANAVGESIPRLAWLGHTFGLTSFDLNVIMAALAPEVDLRYERLYAYLQDDVMRRRPTVDLALNLFSDSPKAKLALRARFSADAPLIRHKLVHLVPDPAQIQPPLLSHYLKLEDQVVGFILGETSLDHRLSSFCRFEEPVPLDAGITPELDTAPALPFLAAQMRHAGRPLTLYFQGAGVSGKIRAAQAIAQAAGARLLIVDLAQAPEPAATFQEVMQLAFREASLQNAVFYIDSLDTLRRDLRLPAYQFLSDCLAKYPGVAIVSGSKPWIPAAGGPAGVRTVFFGVLDRQQALRCWASNLERLGVAYVPDDLSLLADRFRLTPDQIADAVACARNEVLWQSASELAPGLEVTLDELCAAARAECGSELGGLARKIRSKYTWRDIVLPSDQLDQLQEVCQQAKNWQTVFGDWGFDRKLSLGKGLNVLFSGPPGTGKTMAAEVLANDLQLDLYKIDLSQIVSKYIGETEKNLDRIFVLAEHSNAILFFDEADALFGKRSEVKDSHDRYANIEVGYLLQKMEEYEGIAILATNVKHHIDEAFVRRMQVIVEFPFPEEAERRRVWEVIFPEEAPVGRDVDFGALARSVRLAGGNIRNIARASAFYAAGDGGTIRMRHLVKASRREYQKLGREWHELVEVAG
jgi:ATP-dependent 26S proteasome regulatory subunit